MSHIKVYKINETYFQLDIEDSAAMELKDYLSFKMPNFWFSPKYKMGIWDGTLSMFNRHEKKLAIGLLKNFITFCDKFNHTYEYCFNVENHFSPILDIKCYNQHDRFINTKTLSLYDHQTKTIKNAFNTKRGICLLPTGSGKSLIIYILIRYCLENNFKILLLVPAITLVNQMFSDFKEYGWNDVEQYVNILYGGKVYDRSKPVLISTWQSIYKFEQSFFEPFQALFVDECHGVGTSPKIKSCAEKCINASVRLGFTGTLPSLITDKYNLYSFIGKPIIEEKTSNLIEQGILSEVVLATLHLKYPQKVINNFKENKWSYDEEVKFVEDYKNRFKCLDYIFNIVDDGQNVLILCKHTKHLKDTYDYIKDNFDKKYKVYQFHGSVDADERENIRKLTEINDNVIIVSNYQTFSTGVNVKRLHHIISWASYKSEIKIRQAIGRGLRKHETKEQMIWWDVIDDLSFIGDRGGLHLNNLMKHAEQRLSYYQEQKFKVIKREIILDNLINN